MASILHAKEQIADACRYAPLGPKGWRRDWTGTLWLVTLPANSKSMEISQVKAATDGLPLLLVPKPHRAQLNYSMTYRSGRLMNRQSQWQIAPDLTADHHRLNNRQPKGKWQITPLLISQIHLRWVHPLAIDRPSAADSYLWADALGPRRISIETGWLLEPSK